MDYDSDGDPMYEPCLTDEHIQGYYTEEERITSSYILVDILRSLGPGLNDYSRWAKESDLMTEFGLVYERENLFRHDQLGCYRLQEAQGQGIRSIYLLSEYAGSWPHPEEHGARKLTVDIAAWMRTDPDTSRDHITARVLSDPVSDKIDGLMANSAVERSCKGYVFTS